MLHLPATSRRAMLGASALATLALPAIAQNTARDFNPDGPPTRYPDADVVALDQKRFTAKLGNSRIQRLHTGLGWAEGPAWHATGRFLIWSDIPNDECLRMTEEDRHVSRRFRSHSGYSNGNTFDREGRQIACRHYYRDVVRYEPDGKLTVLAARGPNGAFNAPNDAVVHPQDGGIWFTDPGYGGLMDYEGNRLPEAANSPRPLIKEAIYRIDPGSGQVEKVADQPFKPNGLCFSPDYRTLYVADTGVSHYPEAKSIIWAFDVQGKQLTNPRTFCSMEMDGKTGMGDGIRCDEAGNLWVGAGWVGDGYDGVHVFAPDGQRIGLIKLPEICANLCFGGTRRNLLFMCASQSLYVLPVETRGAHFC
ncbi:SMP-30/gluconolactonase/LRE family protein [Pseudoroseomonas wenyumeiae]|uniref:SMP-30/gluconolactonase/LRE family protein n=1 Tax=Teichococcus wenyumeiae TaxID=2478470 RepID=A0A3A9JLD1_9PROT|nr:SMP-30/gluconolactonase/LRE family protein [Pseudoroseomonas wenyumeiae]RKK04524.1 SMP-30/gluconolactonase/LRE family protein [Pseudoroseomonas wenyumeiae]RMI24609.1 SMP-30/gluconolactonase/LRE family protein [Pseudoroseomonas wenyumeiae]